VVSHDFFIFLLFFYHLQYADNVCKQSIQKVRHDGKMLTAKSCFKIKEKKLAFYLMINALQSI